MTDRKHFHVALAAVFAAAFVAACTPRFQSSITPIKSPTNYRTSHQEGGLQIGFHFLSTEEQVEHFGVDMTKADVTPVRIVVRNDDTDEFYIQAEQIFGKTADGDLYPTYRLDQSIERIRRSEIGEAMARGAMAGILIGAAVGAAAGAAIGQAAADDAGGGAAIGAATAGSVGGLSGASATADAAGACDQEGVTQGRLGKPCRIFRSNRAWVHVHETEHFIPGARSSDIQRQRAGELADCHTGEVIPSGRRSNFDARALCADSGQGNLFFGLSRRCPPPHYDVAPRARPGRSNATSASAKAATP